MLIGIDANEANVINRVGSNIYAYELLWQFYKSSASAKASAGKQNFIIYLKDEPFRDLPKQTTWWKYRVIKPAKFWTQWRLPLDLYFHQPQPDVFFTPGHYAPRWSPCPRVMVIMDLSYLYFPEMFRKCDLWQLKKWTAHSLKKVQKILTISKFSQDAIIDYYHLDQEKVVVTYPGMKKSIVKNKKILKKYGLEGDFLLYVGTLQPRKNLVRLIEAFAQLRERNLKLVIVGKKGWLYEEIFAKVKELELEDNVIFTGYVPDEELSSFYQGAQCFVLVSLYEGFGLPVLEAMTYGCPVVTSNVSSLPEVVGDAGILVDPEDVTDIARGIKEAIKKRKILVAKGLKQVKKFSWEKCAQKTLEVLENVAKNH